MANLKPVELLQRPPLTDIPERLRLLANELEEDTRAVLVIEIPSGQMSCFGEVLTNAEVIGTLTSSAMTRHSKFVTDDDG